MKTLRVETNKREQFVDITRQVREAVREAALEDGAVVVYVPHTTAGVAINEGADPAVAVDIQSDLERLIPWNQKHYRHREGNSPSHVRAALVGSSETVLVAGGELVLGTWQAIFFCEFDGPRTRNVHIQPLSA
jgi:secondary thiamine-phosphate synthase enzyme